METYHDRVILVALDNIMKDHLGGCLDKTMFAITVVY